MRAIVCTLLVVAGAGCASKSSTPDLGPSSATISASSMNPGAPTTAGLGSAGIGIQNNSAASKNVIAAPLDKTWEALVKAYAIIPIPLTSQDASTHTLGNTSLKARRKIGDIQLRRALDCGGDNSSPNSETYEITLSVRSQLSADPSGGTLLQTFIEGTGKNPLTNGDNPVPCYSSGGIESRIVDLVKSSTGFTTPVLKKGN